MHPDDTGTTSNGEEQLASAEAAERAAAQAEHADPGRGGSGDSPRDWDQVHDRGRRDEDEAIGPPARGVAGEERVPAPHGGETEEGEGPHHG